MGGSLRWKAGYALGLAHRSLDLRALRSEEKLTAFLELERITRESVRFPNAE
jgi:hypothetical protein